MLLIVIVHCWFWWNQIRIRDSKWEFVIWLIVFGIGLLLKVSSFCWQHLSIYSSFLLLVCFNFNEFSYYSVVGSFFQYLLDLYLSSVGLSISVMMMIDYPSEKFPVWETSSNCINTHQKLLILDIRREIPNSGRKCILILKYYFAMFWFCISVCPNLFKRGPNYDFTTILLRVQKRSSSVWSLVVYKLIIWVILVSDYYQQRMFDCFMYDSSSSLACDQYVK